MSSQNSIKPDPQKSASPEKGGGGELQDSGITALFRLEVQPAPVFSLLSPEAEQLTGIPMDTMLREPGKILDVIDPRDLPAFQGVRAGSLLDLPRRFRLHPKNVPARWVELVSILEHDSSGRLLRIYGAARDLSPWLDVQASLENADRRFDVLLTINQMSDASINEISRYTLEQVVQITGSQYGYFVLIEEGDNTVKLAAFSDAALRDNRISDPPQQFSADNGGPWVVAIRQRQAVIDNNYAGSGSQPPAGHIPIGRIINVPIFDGDRIVAVAGVGNKSEDYVPADADKLALIMTAMWRVISHRRNLESLRNSEERYKTYVEQNLEGIWRFEMGTPIRVDQDTETQVSQIFETGYLDECNHVMAGLFGFPNPEAARGTSVRQLVTHIDPRFNVYLHQFVENQYRVTDAETVEADPLGYLHYYLNSMVGIVENGALTRVWGSRRDVTHQRRSAKIQTVLYEISQAASTCTNLGDLYHSIHTSLGSLMPVQNFFIAIYDPETEIVSYPYFVDQFDEPPEPESLGRTLTGYVLRTGKALLASPELFEDMVESGDVDSVGSPSIDWLGVPLIANEKIIGILAVQSYTEGIRFSEEDKSILQFVSNQIALVIEKKQAEQVLIESEARYRGIVEDQTEFVCRWLESGTPTFVNDAYCRYMDMTHDALIRTNRLDFIHPEDRPAIDGLIQQARRSAEAFSYEIRTIMPSGEVHWEQWTDRALYDGQGTFMEFQSVGQDITERKHREHELEAISNVSSSLRSANNRTEMLPIIADRLMDMLQIDGVALGIIDPLKDEVVFEAGRGIWENSVGLRFPTSHGITGDVIATAEPVISSTIDPSTHLLPREFASGVTSAACYPLAVNRQTIGVAWIGRTSPIDVHTVRLLAAISDIAANAILRSTLHEQTRLRLQRLSILRAIDMAISASLDVRLTLSILLDQVTLQMGVDAGNVLLLNNHTQTLEYAAGRGFQSTAIQNTYLRMGQGHAGKAALERRIITIPNLFEAADATVRRQALTGEQFISYIAVPMISKGQVKGILELFYRRTIDVDAELIDFLQSLGANAAIAIDNAELFDDLQRTNLELSLAYDATIEGWSRALELRDRETEGHTQRVANLTLSLARSVGIAESEMVHLRRGALLHDIGKMAIPDHVLLKTGPLNQAEWEVMHKHPEFAYQLLSPIPYLKPALDIPRYHHEKWDGTGYPFGLSGEQIPLSARIFAIVDVWDALLSDRPYRPAWTRQRTLEYIGAQSGTHFDPRIVKAFLELMNNE